MNNNADNQNTPNANEVADGQQIVRMNKRQNNVTITDVADALGVSKTTVSRAISGKGRIGEKTRKKVLDYIEETNFRPSIVAKGLAKSRTYNIGWVIPSESSMTDLPFFQRCMLGVSEVASEKNYDILISIIFKDDISQLKRVVENHKVDGFILGRSYVVDEQVEYLKKMDVPFVVIGSSTTDDVLQVDNDHISACKELTSILIMKGIKKLALIGGDTSHVVNVSREQGFEQGMKLQGLEVNPNMIFMNSNNLSAIERAVDDCLDAGIRCIVCTDDRICNDVLKKLRSENVLVPEEMKIASFYNSTLLEQNQLGITALQYDPKELGIIACQTLLDYLDGKDVQSKVSLGYEILIKESTK